VLSLSQPLVLQDRRQSLPSPTAPLALRRRQEEATPG